VWPIPAIVFIYLTNGLIPFDGTALPISFYILLAVGLVCSFIFYFTTEANRPPKFILLFALCGFFLAIFWVNWISNILVDLLGLLGLMFNIPTSYLGMTILAWGNSVGDTITNASVARRGLAKMAITGCFAGQFFNLSLGLGISMLKQNLVTGIVPDFSFEENQAFLSLIIAFPLMFALLMIMVFTAINKFELKKWQGYIQLGWWLLIFIITTIAAFGFPNGHF
jgi:solute carrier family 24 (sodium/potassium/calcium exchanger), member 6